MTPAADRLPPDQRALLGIGLWKQDVSAAAFEAIAPRPFTLQRTAEKYQITTSAPNPALHLASATLVLDRRLHPVGEVLRIQSGGILRIVRLIETSYERRPLSSVPDSVFQPSGSGPGSAIQPQSLGSSPTLAQSRLSAPDLQLAELEVAVLAQLQMIGADVGVPIQLQRTPNGQVRIEGVVDDLARKQQIIGVLDALPGRHSLDIHIVTAENIHLPSNVARMRSDRSKMVYTVENSQAPADALIRDHLFQQGFASDQLASLATQFTRDVLGHAERALQEAYALDRLGASFSPSELAGMNADSQHRWAQMAAYHAAVLKRELQVLQQQLDQLMSAGQQSPETADVIGLIQNPDQFARAAHRLLQQMQMLNSQTAAAFTSGSIAPSGQDVATLVRTAAHSIPLAGADRLDGFASRLAASDVARSQASGRK
jgi:hypothetical protein